METELFWHGPVRAEMFVVAVQQSRG